MDVATYRLMQDSGWVREQRDAIGAGETRTCPVASCFGTLAPYDEGGAARLPGDVPAPGGVFCSRCGARSRPVAL